MNRRKYAFSIALAALTSAAWMPMDAPGQAYPSKPIRVVVPFPPGASSLDIMVRLVTPKMSAGLGQPIIVDNRAGANGMIGSDHVARSAPDGYTLLSGTSSTHLSSVFLLRGLPYDPLKDFTPVIALVDPTTALMVHPSLAVHTVRELVEYAKRNPGKLSYASWGQGGFAHLSMELFKQAAGVDIVHVPYKGAAAATADLVAGRVEVGIVSRAAAGPILAAGKLRQIALMDRYTGVSADAEVVGESVPGFEKLYSFYGLLGPAGLPRPIVDRLHAEAQKALEAPDLRAKLDALSLAVLGGTPEDFTAAIRKGLATYGKAIARAGIQPE